MSRSGYSDDCEQWALIRWRGAVNSSIKGKRGQQFLRELAAAMDAMPQKRLIAEELQADGEFCALGVIGAARGVDMANVDPHDRERVAKLFNVAEALAAEIMFENDDRDDTHDSVSMEICGPVRPDYPEWGSHTRHVWMELPNVPERRWQRMRGRGSRAGGRLLARATRLRRSHDHRRRLDLSRSRAARARCLP